MVGRKESRPPVLRSTRPEAAVVRQDDERRQIVVQTAQAIADPGPHAGKPGCLKAGGLQQRRLAMNAGLANHVVDEGDLIDTWAERGGDIAEGLAPMAV